MKTNLKTMGCLLIMTISSIAYAQKSSPMQEAMELHDKAQNFEEELKAAKAFQDISDKNPSDWLSAYWTAFIYSQAGRLSNEKIKYYNIGFEYLNRSNEVLDNPTIEQTTYLSALEALLSGLAMTPHFIKGDSKTGGQLAQRQKDAINKGLRANPESPLLYVLLGTSQMGEGFRSNDLTKITSGKTLLKQAKIIYSQQPTKNSLTPDRWNEPWIDVWLSRVDS